MTGPIILIAGLTGLKWISFKIFGDNLIDPGSVFFFRVRTFKLGFSWSFLLLTFLSHTHTQSHPAESHKKVEKTHQTTTQDNNTAECQSISILFSSGIKIELTDKD